MMRIQADTDLNDAAIGRIKRETTFSDCRKYRFTLWRCTICASQKCRHWLEPDVKFVQFIWLNPSKADENINDPTVTRGINFAASWGFHAMCVTNAFGFRATDPDDMKANPDEVPVFSRANALCIEAVAREASLIVCGWGVHGNYKNRGAKILHHLRHEMKLPVHHLGLNNDGTPKHPLYLRADLKPIPFQ